MTPLADLPSIIASATAPRGLRPRQDLREPNWSFWELRNLNIHRVVGLFDERRQFEDARDLEAEIRGVVSRRFKRSWWRGMAYGVVAVVGVVSLSPVYRDILHALEETKCHVTSVKRDKDGLMKFLTGVADVNVAVRSLGTRRVAFPEFREPSLRENETRLGSPDD